MVRRASTEKFDRIEHIRDRITLHQGDLLDQRSLVDTLRASKPSEIYNLAAMRFVAVSWIQPTLTAEFTGVGVTRMLEAMREVVPRGALLPGLVLSEMFGKVREVPQTETTPFYPRSPYGVAKAYGHFITVNYRESYDLHATSGILFNHESPRRGLEFVTRKITWHAAAIKHGLRDELRARQPRRRARLGLREGLRRGDVADAPAGRARGLRDRDRHRHTRCASACEVAFDEAGLGDWEQYVEIDPAFVRPAEVDHLIGDYSQGRARARLGAADELRGADPADDRARPGAARAELSDDARTRSSTPPRRSRRCARRSTPRSTRVVDSGAFILGPEVEAFERGVRRLLRRRARGRRRQRHRRADHRAARARASGPATTSSSRRSPSTPAPRRSRRPAPRPVFCDVDPETFCVTAETVSAALTPRTQGRHRRAPLRQRRARWPRSRRSACR